MESETNQQKLTIEVKVLKSAASVLRAVNHKLRMQILQMIDKKQRITVSEIYHQLRLEQSVVSQHLAILRKAGFVKTERSGKYIYYSVKYEKLKQVDELNKLL